MMFGQFVEYKGYIGSIEYDSEDAVYYGCVMNTLDLVNYEGDSIEELYQYYQEAIDDYIEFKKEISNDND